MVEEGGEEALNTIREAEPPAPNPRMAATDTRQQRIHR
jgi:hypothetical protein